MDRLNQIMIKGCLALFLGVMFSVPKLNAQDLTVTGTVYDSETNTSLPGVNIVVKGTNIGTTSDASGNFIENVPSPTDTLVFSFVGYRTREVPVDSRTEISVGLVPQTIAGDEVVVVGYGEQRRENVTGSISSLEPEKIQDIPAGNLSTLLEGRMPGVGISNRSGRPGSHTSLSIRADGSLNGEPVLYVIDGFVQDQEAFDALDPIQIENLSVLKGPSAAIYGARAAGGVVLVKTKRGQEGKATISYSGSAGFANATKFTDMLSGYQHARLSNSILRAQLPDSYASQPDYYTQDELDYFKKYQYNWLETSWKTAPTYRHTLNVSGGTEDVRYFAGGAYYDEKGNLPSTQYNKYSLRLGMDADITDDLSASVTLSANRDKDDRPYNREDRNPDPMNDTFTQLLQTPRWIPPYINGNPVGQYEQVIGNPLAINQNNNYKKSEGSGYTLNAALNYDIPTVEGLEARLAYSINERNVDGEQYSQDYYLYNFVTTGQHNHILTSEVAGEPYRVNNDEKIEQSHNYSQSYQLNGSLSYARTFGSHNVDAMAGFEQAESSGYNTNQQREEQLIAGWPEQAAYSEAEDRTDSRSSNNSRLSFISRINYNYAEKYLLDATFRYEGSIKFASDDRWGFFPSIGLGWRMSNEPFFNVSFIDNLKLRFSAGLLGNDSVGRREYLLSYGLADGAYLGGSNLTNAVTARNSGITISSATWEKSSSYNGGVDVRFSNNISFSLDGFYRYTYDILGTRASTLPTASGIDELPAENYGRVASWGYEISVGYDGVIGNEVSYNIGLNTGWSRKEILEVYQNPEVYGTWQDQIGTSGDRDVGFISTGIIRTQEEVDQILEGNPDYTIFGRTPEPGMLNYKDVGGPDFSGPDGKIDDNDLRHIDKAPGFLGFNGLDLSLGASWKGFQMSTTLQLSGVGEYVFFDEGATNPLDDGLNSPVFWKDHWTSETPNAAYPRPYEYGGVGQTSTFWRRNALQLDMNVLTASYSLPNTLLTQLGISQVRVYFAGRNLWNIINPYGYKDPNVNRFNSYPVMRTFNFGLNIKI